MAGLCQPRAAYALVKALREEVGLPIHFHTHDTSGIAAASVLAAADAGVDAVDAALDSMSGLTSQPNLSSIVAALRHGARDTGLEHRGAAHVSDYWEQVRALLRAVRERHRAPARPTSTCTRCRAASTPICASRRGRSGSSDRWPEVARAYAAGQRSCSATSSR